jgi:hypothetical protein
MKAESINILKAILMVLGRSSEYIKNVLLSVEPDTVILLREMLLAMIEQQEQEQETNTEVIILESNENYTIPSDSETDKFIIIAEALPNSITPPTGKTISGLNEFIFDAPYQAVQILKHNNNYYLT